MAVGLGRLVASQPLLASGNERRGAWSDRAPLLYRFTVRCDREQNRLIEKRAKACGLSPTAYVQKHFERLFEEDAAGVTGAAPTSPLVGEDTETRRSEAEALVDVGEGCEEEREPLALPAIAARRTDDDEWEAAAPRALDHPSPTAANGSASPHRALVSSPTRGEEELAPILGRGAQKFLDTLARLKQEDGTVLIGLAALGQLCGVSSGAAQWQINRLLSLGLIERVSTGSRREASTYRVLAGGGA